MNIIQILREKSAVLGRKEVCKALDITEPNLSRYLATNEKHTGPNFKTCQKIIDTWFHEYVVKEAEKKIEVPDEKEMDIIMRNVPIWEGKDVCLCLPIYKECHPRYMFCIMAMWDKEKMRLEMRDNDSMIARSRNQIAKRFLDTGCTWSVWFDDDMIFPFGNAGIYYTFLGQPNHVPHEFLNVHTINRLISWNKTVVGGCYWDRRGSGRMIAGGSQPILSPIPSNTLAPVKFVGTGCLAVHRQVYLDVLEKFPDILSDQNLGNESGFFTPIQGKDRMWGEDESFAWRATEAGHPSYLDLGIICGHYGTVPQSLPKSGSKL